MDDPVEGGVGDIVSSFLSGIRRRCAYAGAAAVVVVHRVHFARYLILDCVAGDDGGGGAKRRCASR